MVRLIAGVVMMMMLAVLAAALDPIAVTTTGPVIGLVGENTIQWLGVYDGMAPRARLTTTQASPMRHRPSPPSDSSRQCLRSHGLTHSTPPSLRLVRAGRV